VCHPVVDFRIAIEKNPLPWHLDIIEDDQGVLLVETARKRMVGGVRLYGIAIATDALQPWSVHRNGKRQGIARGVFGNRLSRIDGNLIRKRRQGGQQAGTTYQDTVFGVGHLVQRDCSITGVDIRQPFINGGMHNGMRERQVAPCQFLVESTQVGGSRFVAEHAPDIRSPGKARHADVDIVRRAAEDAEAPFGNTFQTGMASVQVGS
jgi:hypothetical protein